MIFFENLKLEELKYKFQKTLGDSVPNVDLEDIKNREILNIAYKCVTGMLDLATEKLDDGNELIKSLKKTKEDIENMFKLAKVTTQAVIYIVQSVLEYKKILESLGMILSILSPFFQLLLFFVC